MGVFVRALLVWLVVLAVPLQGAAAASMAFCGATHHGGGPALAAVSTSAFEHTHHGGADLEHHFDADVSSKAVIADDGSSMSKAGQAVDQTCSVCASCCSSGAMLATLPVVPATESAPTVFTTVVPTVDAFAADGPDRPPRGVLA
jgi:hypothetical protein